MAQRRLSSPPPPTSPTSPATGANALPALSSDPSRFPPQPEFPYTNSGSPHNILSEIQHFYSPQHSWSSPLAISGPSRPSTSTVHPFAASPSTPSRGSSSASSSRASRAALEALMSTNHPSPARRGRRGLRTQLTREDSLEHQNKSTLTPAGSGTSTPANEAKSANDVPWRVPRYLASSNYSHCFATSPAASNVDASRSKILLPSKWDPLQKAELLTIADDGLQVTFKNILKTTDKDAAAVRADRPAPVLSGVYYYEVQILSKGMSGFIGVGFSGKNVSLNRLPGWEGDSYGYHGDDGNVFSSHGTGKAFGPTFTTSDVIGCGIDFISKRCFYTKNGCLVGHAFQNVTGELYPSIGMRTAGESLRVNFGQQEFCFDIQHFVEERREQYYDSILNSSIRSSYLDDTDAARNEKQSQLEQAENLQNSSRPTSPRLETTLAKLVSSYLNFHAHLDTAEAFEKEREASMANLRGIQGQASATSMAVDEDSSNDNVESLESRRCRRSILEAVKAGRHLEARQIVKEQYHEALESTGASGLPLDFQLRSRHFLETVLNTSAGSSSMGMDLDSISAKSAGKETEAGPVESSSTVDAVLDDLLLFGQELHRDYGSSKDTRITSMLMSLSSLLAYTNPREATDTDIQSLILEAGQAGRESLATEVNGTLLTSIGLSDRSNLEHIARQTSAVRNQLADMDEGAAAYLSLW